MLRFLSLLFCHIFLLFSTLAEDAQKVESVTIGAYVNNIQALDLKSHSFAMDLYLWFRWRDRDINPAASVEFINPHESWGHSVRTSFDQPKELPTGELYQVLRIEGRFSEKFDLSRYPFDKQTLRVLLEDNVHGAGRIQFKLDDVPVAINPDLKLPGFYLGPVTLQTQTRSYPTTFGDPTETKELYSRVSLSVPISRPRLTYVLKLLLPLLCVLLCAGLMCFLSVEWVDARVGMGITAVLSLVALQITLNDELPEVDYLTLIDKLYLGAYLLILSCLGLAIYSTSRMKQQEHGVLLRRERWVFSVLFLAFMAYGAILAC